MCVCVCVCRSIDSQSMPWRPTLMGFLWLKKVKGEYNDIKTWWLHPGSDHSAPRQLPDRARLEGGKERETEQTREGEEETEKQNVDTNVWNKGCALWKTPWRPVSRSGTAGEGWDLRFVESNLNSAITQLRKLLAKKVQIVFNICRKKICVQPEKKRHRRLL